MKLTIDDVRPEVRDFAICMEAVLRKHDGKVLHWRNLDKYYLFSRLLNEVAELGVEVTRRNGAIQIGMFIVQEAIDVANFAMMIADNHNMKRVLDDILDILDAKMEVMK